ncbi:MAG: hypothetical protein HKM93_20565 [Desulfobacteraceae bacterium]|nr:hypothetical protein [Desulfobacteraceae bacterium]
MALDEPKDTDDVFEVDGFKYVIEKEFIEKVQPIKVDYHMYGFKLDCGVEFSAPEGNACGGCSSSGNCG